MGSEQEPSPGHAAFIFPAITSAHFFSVESEPHARGFERGGQRAERGPVHGAELILELAMGWTSMDAYCESCSWDH
jgi:hypothetical protein